MPGSKLLFFKIQFTRYQRISCHLPRLLGRLHVTGGAVEAQRAFPEAIGSTVGSHGAGKATRDCCRTRGPTRAAQGAHRVSDKCETLARPPRYVCAFEEDRDICARLFLAPTSQLCGYNVSKDKCRVLARQIRR